jgi:hypothetical protein
MSVIKALGKLKKKNHEFEGNLDYTARLLSQSKQTTIPPNKRRKRKNLY